MILEDYKSLCEPKQKQIICRDRGNKQKYVANNTDSDYVYQYRFDGDIVREGKRCDYLLWNDTKKHLYFIELKGTDLGYALEQIDASEMICKKNFPKKMKECKSISYRVILNKVRTTAIYNTKEKAFKRRHVGDLIYRTMLYEETI